MKNLFSCVLFISLLAIVSCSDDKENLRDSITVKNFTFEIH